MNAPYQPSSSLRAKIARRTLVFRATRHLHFNLTRPIVSFTFDDFPRSAITNGSNILEIEDWRATFYVAAGLMGVSNHHGAHFLSKDIPALAERGHEIAGHTLNHIDCDKLGLDGTKKEISRNIKAIKSMGYTGNIEHFAYPFGAANTALKLGLQNQFKTMRGITGGVHMGKVDLNGLKSEPIFSGPKFNKTLQTINSLKTQPGWLTLFTHDVRKNPSEWGCTPEDFKTVIQAVKNTGARVLPVGAAVKYLESTHE